MCIRDRFQAICDDADVPTQAFANKSDMAGGSTLGNLSNMQASMHAVDAVSYTHLDVYKRQV